MRRVVVQITSVDETGDSLHRMVWPAQQLAKQEPEWLVLNVDANAMERLELAERADLLVLFQPHDLDLFKVIHRRRRQGLKTLIECVDHFYEPPPSSPAYAAWRSPVIQGVYEEFFRLADGIIVTSEALGEVCQTFGPPIHILKNHLASELQKLDEVLKAKPVGVQLCWAGSIGHAADLIAVLPTVEEFMRDRPEIVFALMGNTALPSLLHVESDRVNFTPWGDMEQYFAFLRNAHIGIVPLLNTPYNRCRSDVKAVEMVGAGVLPLLPAAPPYTEFLRETGLPSWQTFEELKTLLTRYVDDPVKRRTDLDGAYKYVKAKRLGKNETTRRDLYQQYFPGSRATPDGQWPARNGFLPFQGTGSLGPLWRESLNVVQARLRRGDAEGAQSLISESLRDHDGNAELVLLFASLLAGAALIAPAASLLAQGLERYPRDIRFCAMQALLEPELVKKVAYWEDVKGRLLRLNPQERECWSPLILDLWQQETSKDCTNAVEETLSELFQTSIAWRAHRALYLIEQRSPDAIQHCIELGTLYQELENGQAALRGFTAGYWRSFAAGITAHRAGSLGWGQT